MEACPLKARIDQRPPRSALLLVISYLTAILSSDTVLHTYWRGSLLAQYHQCNICKNVTRNK